MNCGILPSQVFTKWVALQCLEGAKPLIANPLITALSLVSRRYCPEDWICNRYWQGVTSQFPGTWDGQGERSCSRSSDNKAWRRKEEATPLVTTEQGLLLQGASLGCIDTIYSWQQRQLWGKVDSERRKAPMPCLGKTIKRKKTNKNKQQKKGNFGGGRKKNRSRRCIITIDPLPLQTNTNPVIIKPMTWTLSPSFLYSGETTCFEWGMWGWEWCLEMCVWKGYTRLVPKKHCP